VRFRAWRDAVFLTGHDLNVVAGQLLASRDYLFTANGQRSDVLAGTGTSPLEAG